MRESTRVVTEAAAIAVVGAAVAVFANAKNPAGLDLGRDYFKFARQVAPATAVATNQSQTPQASATQPAAATTASATTGSAAKAASAERDTDQIIAVLRNNGLEPIDHESVVKLHKDPWFQQGLYLFVDARNEDDYAAGHIPGAYSLFPFAKDEVKQQQMSEFLQVASGAQKVVVYCNGGHCDDSIQMAVDLRSNGLDPTKIAVYAGGIHAWTAAGLSLEKGARGSGDLQEAGK